MPAIRAQRRGAVLGPGRGGVGNGHDRLGVEEPGPGLAVRVESVEKIGEAARGHGRSFALL